LGVLYKKDFSINNYDELSKEYTGIQLDDAVKVQSEEIDELLKDDKEHLTDLQLIALAYAIYGIKDSFARIVYDENVIHNFRYDAYENQTEVVQEDKKYTSPDLIIDDSDIDFEVRTIKKGRASKAFNDDEDLEKVKALDYGTRLHAYLELSDFVTKDTSFIKDFNDRKKIDAVLHLDIFDHLEGTSLYHEYSYFDPDLNSNGSIDLLIVYPDHIDIIDYKTKDIDDPEYIRQLNIYRRNIERIMPGKEIHMILLSILEARSKEVEKVDITD
jgi:hypothetical protein